MTNITKGRKTLFDVDFDTTPEPVRHYNNRANAETLRMCEVAWALLLRHKWSGLTGTGMKAWMTSMGENVGNEFNLTLEKNGYLLWIDNGNRLKPFRHPNGEFVEYAEMTLFSLDKAVNSG